MTDFITNAVIDSAEIQFSRGIFLDCWLYLNYGSTQQGFGGYVLGGNPFTEMAANKHGEQPNLCGDFIAHVLAIAGVEKFSELAGKVIRVRKTDEWGDIIAIGHPIKDRWFNPKESFAAYKGEAA